MEHKLSPRRLRQILVLLVSVAALAASFAVSTSAVYFYDENGNREYIDAKVSDWARTNVERAQTYTGYYSWDYTQPMSRGEFAEFTYNAVKYMASYGHTEKKVTLPNAENPFRDTDSQAVASLAALGILEGKGNRLFAPEDTLTREEAAAIEGRIFDLFGFSHIDQPVAFADREAISPWAIGAVDALCPYQIFIGMNGGIFSPKTELTREQAITVGVRFINLSSQVESSCDVDGYHIISCGVSTYLIKDDDGNVLRWYPKQSPPELGLYNTESYFFLNLVERKGTVYILTTGIEKDDVGANPKRYSISVTDFTTGEKILTVKQEIKDRSIPAYHYGLTSDGETLITYTVIETGNMECGYEGVHEYTVYRLSDGELLFTTRDYQDLYDNGYLLK